MMYSRLSSFLTFELVQLCSKVKLVSCLLLIFFSSNCLLSAQEEIEPCGLDEIRLLEEQRDPYIAINRKDNEKLLQSYLNSQTSEQKDNDTEVISIPVVFHILYNTEEQNIADSMVYNQMEAINEDFRRLNFDTLDTPDFFKPDASDTRIEFCLAQRDPEGNASNGITRTFTEKESFSFSSVTFENISSMHYDERGGKNIWDRDHYLNVWVCNPPPPTPTGGATLAFAYLPGAHPEVDGIVCDYHYFGRPTINGDDYNLGRTMTHEIGHWLNLYHVFAESDGSFCSDDYVEDTPPQSEAVFGCPEFPYSTCDNVSDQYMNFMDYANDSCSNMFSKGQTERMRAAIRLFRPGLLSSMGCQPYADNDVRVTQITAPDPNYCISNSVPIIATFKNEGLNNLESLELNYSINDTPFQTANWTGNLALGESAELFLGIGNGNDGLNSVKVFSSSPNGMADAYTLNDTLIKAYVSGLGVPTPFLETFEEAYPENGWTMISESPSVPWQHIPKVLSADGNVGGIMAVRHDFHDYFDELGTNDDFYSPVIDVSTLTAPQLSFDYSYQYSEGHEDAFQVNISNDCGFTYTEVFLGIGEEMETRNARTPRDSSDWQNLIIDLSDFAGGNLLINFKTTTDGGNWMMIDNVEVYDSEISGINSETEQKSNLQLSAFHDSSTSNLFVNLQMTDSNSDKNVQFSLYSYQGNELANWESQSLELKQKFSLDVAEIPAGLYLLKAQISTSNNQTEKVIKVWIH